ncbi:MAG: Prepilin-type N-terminal cleavage/methylation protein [Magnetococcales bacterium]|nr:Prepilin-type N-terminal cleavage/methylation protein [Magnetococcales bacterium]
MMILAKKSTRMSGFTLIEVMVSMVLTGILVAGVVGLWGMVADQFFRLSLRQKAVFVLHGHMERLAMLYRTQANTKTLYASSTGYSQGGGTARVILYVDTNTARSTDPLMKTSAASKSNFDDGYILYLDQGASGLSAEDRNIVWLDRDKDVTAQISFTLDASPDPDSLCYPDADSTGCHLLTLFLDYPYRFVPGTTPANNVLPGIAVETISVQTIVGARK